MLKNMLVVQTEVRRLSEFDQKKFNIYTVRVLQELLENAGNFSNPLADDFAVLCELLWTYDHEYQSLESTTKMEES